MIKGKMEETARKRKVLYVRQQRQPRSKMLAQKPPVVG
jgi:hypothetical protein